MKTVATFFSGGELFGMGAKAAGYEHIWGVEKDDKIAAVARLNGLHVITGDVRSIDLSTLARPDHFHVSPPCPNFSRAKKQAVETELDIQLAEAICEALTVFRPETFTLENVVGYRDSESFRRIAQALNNLGYWWDAKNLNAADFGVPQTRIRLIVRARRGLLLGYPAPVKWKGWYQAVEDLIPSLPDSKFAPWQLARLPQEYKNFMIGNGQRSYPLETDSPAPTITSNRNQNSLRAFIVPGGNATSFSVRDDDEPARTVESVERVGNTPRAFVLNGGNINANSFAPRDADEPHTTVTASMDRTPSRAFVLDGQLNEGDRITSRHGEDPIFTMAASGEKRPARAYANGRVVKLDIRCLGRFQTVPDSYQGLTVKINGNGFPCLLAQRVLETFS